MSNNNNDQRKKPLPTFSGAAMPMNISVDVDDDVGEEVTRRVGGFSFGPAPTTLHAPAQPSPFAGPSMSTLPQKASAQTGGSPMVQSASNVPPPKVWKLSDAPVLPEFHPLERTAVFVPYTSVKRVAARISEILRERSIEAVYDNSKAKVTCTTATSVEFRIRLYRGRQTYSHGIIVEVQRRFGTSNDFHDLTTAILDAAEGKPPGPPPPSTSLPMVTDEDDYELVDPSSSLSFAARLLGHPGRDAQYLALQSLSSLTDPSKMGKQTAKGISNAILETNNEVGRKLFEIMADSNGGDHLGLQQMAMSVVANVMQATSKTVPLAVSRVLRPVLLECARASESSPGKAYLATLCLERFINNDQNTSELQSAFEQARSVGAAQHRALQLQAQKCLDMISRR